MGGGVWLIEKEGADEDRIHRRTESWKCALIATVEYGEPVDNEKQANGDAFMANLALFLVYTFILMNCLIPYPYIF